VYYAWNRDITIQEFKFYSGIITRTSASSTYDKLGISPDFYEFVKARYYMLSLRVPYPIHKYYYNDFGPVNISLLRTHGILIDKDPTANEYIGEYYTEHKKRRYR
jgi:hypothetical protein